MGRDRAYPFRNLFLNSEDAGFRARRQFPDDSHEPPGNIVRNVSDDVVAEASPSDILYHGGQCIPCVPRNERYLAIAMIVLELFCQGLIERVVFFYRKDLFLGRFQKFG